MKNKNLFLLTVFFLFALILNANTSHIDPDEYVVKLNDIFIFESTLMMPNNSNPLVVENESTPTAQTIQSKVTPFGVLSLFPFSDTLMVAGKTLTQVYKEIDLKLKKKFKTNSVSFYLAYVSPINFNITGLVVRPGAYVSEEMPTLCKALVMAGGTGASSSKVITILRDKKKYEFDLKKYLNEGDVDNNPLIYNDDVIYVRPAKNYIKVYTNNDTINFVESVEITDSTKISDVMELLFKKHQWSNLNKFSVFRNDEYFAADLNFQLKTNDKLFIPVEELYIYVTGHVSRPGRYVYNGSNDINYYISQAGGQTNTGTRKGFFIINKDGIKEKYVGQALKQGDIIYVPESLKSIVISYMAPVSTVISLIYTIVLINNNLNK